MSFTPIIPTAGLAGWAFLSRTRPQQEASFNSAPQLNRDVTYLKETLPKINSPDDLVGNRRILRIALSAFGLQDDLDNRAFIRKIVEDGTSERGALANRLTDKRYLAFAETFSYLTEPGAVSIPDGLLDRITTQFQRRQFEVAVGEQDQNMRLALSLQREIPQIAEQFKTPSAQWFAVLGNPPLREILQTGLGFPKEFARLDIDSQSTRMRAAAQKRFGTSDLTELSTPEGLERITRRFLAMSQLRESQETMNGAATALILLQSARRS